MSLPIRVTKGRVLIKPDLECQEVEQTDGGLYVAKTLEAAVEGQDARVSWYTGTVLAIGDRAADFDVRPFLRRTLRDLLECATYAELLQGVETVIRELDDLPVEAPCDFQPGDLVTFSAQAGSEITIDGDTYLIVNVADVLGVLEPA